MSLLIYAEMSYHPGSPRMAFIRWTKTLYVRRGWASLYKLQKHHDISSCEVEWYTKHTRLEEVSELDLSVRKIRLQ